MDFGGPFGVVIGHHAMMVNWVEFYGTPNVDDDSNEYIDDYCGWNFVDDNNDVAGGPLNSREQRSRA